MQVAPQEKSEGTTSTPPVKKDEHDVPFYPYPDLDKQRRIRPLSPLPPALRHPIFIGALVGIIAAAWRYQAVKDVLSTVLDELRYSRLFLLVMVMIVITLIVIVKRMGHDVYLQDFTVTFPPESDRLTREETIALMTKSGAYDENTIEFQKRLIMHSGIGDETYLPLAVTADLKEITVEKAREECKHCFTSALDQLFARTGLKPKDIDVLITTCSLFNPTPSIAAMIVNHYKLRHDCKTFSFGGMGCSAGLIAVDLAKDLLRHAKTGTKVVIFSHENITLNWYQGKRKGMLIPNLLFRENGAAVLMTNEYCITNPPKYRLNQSVRIYKTDDEANHAIYQQEDDEGIVGVSLSKQLVDHVTKGIFKNFFYVGLKNLTFAEQAKYIVDYVHRKLSPSYATQEPPYVPNFSKSFKHYCIHCGGRAIIDGMQKNLHLTDQECLASRAALYRFGNTSSASLWYEMNYIELAEKQKPGEKIFQVTFGSGLKVNSAVWETL